MYITVIIYSVSRHGQDFLRIHITNIAAWALNTNNQSINPEIPLKQTRFFYLSRSFRRKFVCIVRKHENRIIRDFLLTYWMKDYGGFIIIILAVFRNNDVQNVRTHIDRIVGDLG